MFYSYFGKEEMKYYLSLCCFKKIIDIIDI